MTSSKFLAKPSVNDHAQHKGRRSKNDHDAKNVNCNRIGLHGTGTNETV
jgi:hypothetical protein